MFKVIFIIVMFWGTHGSAIAKSDPTSPLIGGHKFANQLAAKKNKIVLQSIIKSVANSVNYHQLSAVISGQLVKQGDTVFGYQVAKIDRRSVTLKSTDSTRKLMLFPQQIVKYN